MNYTMFSTEFIGTAQNMSLDKSGNTYYISLSQGGYKYNDTELPDIPYDVACSPNFDTLEEAMAFYCRLLTVFGAGMYDFNTRMEMVRKGDAE